MTSKVWQALLRFWTTDRALSFFLVLLLTVVFVLPVQPPAGPFGKILADSFFSMLLITGVAAVSERRWITTAASAVVAAALLTRWADSLLPPAHLAEWRALFRMAALSLFAVVVSAQVFRAGTVTFNRIQGAVAVYLLLGLAWAAAYELLAIRQPDAFKGEVGGPEDAQQSWVYYSLVTLTTMGYGDITPVHPAARSLATLEALVGQLYPAILLARLVSLEVQTRPREK